MDPQMTQMQGQIKKLEAQMRQAMSVVTALQGQPSDATLALPHNDSWLDNDNVDGTHPFNLRYVISSNVTRVVSARLSVHLAAYRTYNSDAGANTGGGTNHAHSTGGETGHSHNHGHSIHITPGVTAADLAGGGSGGGIIDTSTGSPYDTGTVVNSNANGSSGHNHGNTGGETTHTHPLNLVQTLGVTEGASPTGITISFDGVDHTADLGGPFSLDVVELDVRPYLAITTGVWHTIAMQPTGNGRIEAHLRLGVYVAAGSVF